MKTHEWLPVEQAPRDGTRILLTVAGGINYYPEIAHWDNERSQWVICVTRNGTRIVFSLDPTHFMFLPDSPKL